MSRAGALARAEEFFDSGGLFTLLAKRVAYPTESPVEERGPEARAYLTAEMLPYLEAMGFSGEVVPNPELPRLPLLVAARVEGDGLPTVLVYGHGDTVRGMGGRWRGGLDPWTLTAVGDRWYGRGTADNKGQHTINLAALDAVLRERGRLGFNVKVLIEMAEEVGSPGLHRVCREGRDRLRADVLIASDGPRLSPGEPTLFCGSRGVANFDISVDLREGAHHSGNWGGLLANPGVILANALTTIVDGRGRILVPELRPPPIPESVRQALARVRVTGEGGPPIDPGWGEPGLTPAEKVYGWNTFEVLAFTCGDPDAPVHAIPPRAWARCHIRYVKGSDPARFLRGLRRHLAAHGFFGVRVRRVDEGAMVATRTDPDHPWVRWARTSVARTCGRDPVVLPNLGGSLPNDAFSDILGLPTVWVPHSYSGCSQHAPDEHLLAPVAREGLRIMAGLFWDLGEEAGRPRAEGGNEDHGPATPSSTGSLDPAGRPGAPGTPALRQAPALGTHSG